MDMNFQKENRHHINSLIANDMIENRPPANEMQLRDLIRTIVGSWRMVCASVFIMLLMGLTYIFLATPIYQADVLLQVEEKSQGISGLAELSDILQEDSPVTAEFEILRSRMVLGNVVSNLKLDIVSKPKHFPIAGLFLSQNLERIKVENFEIPGYLQNEPFKLVAGEDNDFTLFTPGETLQQKAEIGKPISVSLSDGNFIRLFVSELNGKPGAQFEIIKKDRLTAINNLKQNLKIVEQGERSGVLRIILQGDSRIKVTTILNEIANIYLRQSVERKSAEAEKTLVFLEKQLPLLKDKMENAEAALNSYRLQKGSVDLSMETQSTLEKIVSVDALLTQLRSDREVLIRQFTPEHPRIASIDAQILNLNKEIRKVDSKIKGLPGTQQEILRLTRDLEVSSSLYTSLMNSAQELKIVKAGAVGNVRIVDYAMTPDLPVKPNKGFVLSLVSVLGVVLGIGISLIRKNMHGAIDDPDIIENKLGLPVYASIPYSRKQKKLDYSIQHTKTKNNLQKSLKMRILASVDTDDLAIESLRSLRTSIYLTNQDTKNNMLLMSSPAPEAGKSFLCINLAAILADTGKRTLLIDADLRKGRIHEILGIQRSMGLTDLIAGDLDFKETIHKTDINNLFVLTVGSKVINPSELLMQNKFENILEKLSPNFDQIIIDSAPVLAVTDATIIGRLAGLTLLVVKDSQCSLREIEEAVKHLKHANVNLRGVVYNGMKLSNSRYGKFYKYSYSDIRK